MNDAERRLLHALVLADPYDAAAAASAYLAGVDLQVLPWNQTRLLPALYKRMSELGLDAPPLLRGTYRRAWTANQARFRAAATTMAALDAAGIRNVVLKGASLVPAYGGDWGVRDMADVDLLVEVGEVHRAAALLEELGWRAGSSVTAAAALARYARRRHSWNFWHPDGPGLDLHWHVLAGSRGPGSDRAFLAAAVPLDVGAVRALRLCDADLLLHVLEHAAHGEDPSKLLWIVDVVHLVRSVPDVGAVAERLDAQARAHDLDADVRRRLAEVHELTGDPAVAAVQRGLGRATAHRRPVAARRRPPPEGSRRARYAEFRRGGTPPPAAALAWVRAEVDAPLARRPAAWTAYVATGRRPAVERVLTRLGGALTRVPAPGEPAAVDGWWELTTAEAVDALCGPGWSFPEPLAGGVWTDGAEARLSIPIAADLAAAADVAAAAEGVAVAGGVDGRAVVELDVFVLGRHGGAPHTVSWRAGGRTLAALEAGAVDAARRLAIPVPASRGGTAEVSVRIDAPVRPVDLGIGPDTRRLGVMLRRVRVRPAAGA